MYIARTLEPHLLSASRHFPVVMVTGARQVGKTTCLRHLTRKSHAYVTLDDPGLRSMANEDPALFFQQFPGPLLIDEIQYAPTLLPHIKMMVDATPGPGRYFLTGSQQFQMMKNVSESLAGRVGIVQMLGFAWREQRGLKCVPFIPPQAGSKLPEFPAVTLPDLFARIWRGSFPAIATGELSQRQLFYSSYLKTYLERDIHALARVGDELAFIRFLRAAAARTGQLLNTAELARDADVAPNTAKAWLSILQASGIVRLIEPWHSNLTKRLVKTPKLYFLDTGLCAYLTEWESPATLQTGALAGAILETFWVSELLKSYLHNGLEAPFYFYRDKDQVEIDLLIRKNNTLHPVEFKKSANPKLDDVRHFGALKRSGLAVGAGALICLTPSARLLSSSVVALPAGSV